MHLLVATDGHEVNHIVLERSGYQITQQKTVDFEVILMEEQMHKLISV